MRKIVSDSGNYLKSKASKCLGKAVLTLLCSAVVLSITTYRILFQPKTICLIEVAGFVAALIGLGMFQFYQRRYRIYKGGWQGEKTVIKTLSNNLNDDYYLINGACLKGGGGDVDHIVIGPSGVYVLETKNWNGKIICHGDQWQRPGKKVKTSPSLQVKYNTQKVRKIINPTPTLSRVKIWIEGVLIFTNNRANLNINNPTITILNLQQLPDYIKNQKFNHLTKEQVQKIIKQIQTF